MVIPSEIGKVHQNLRNLILILRHSSGKVSRSMSSSLGTRDDDVKPQTMPESFCA